MHDPRPSSEALVIEQHIRVKRCRNGLFMYNANDMYVGRSLDLYGEFSEGEAVLFRQVIKPGMIVLDIGANIGVHTMTFAQLVGKNGWVIAFEPQRVIHQMLGGNIALNGIPNVSIMLAGLGRTAGMINVPRADYSKEGNFGGVYLMEDEAAKEKKIATESVPLQTLDSFNLPKCDFIKIDVEGMEQAVIEGSLQTLERCRPILYVENDRWEKSEALIECLNRAGYKAYWHVTTLYNPENYYGNTENVFPNLASFNALCVPAASGIVLKELIEITPQNANKPP